MKRSLLTLSLLICSASIVAMEPASAPNNEVEIMTYNVRRQGPEAKAERQWDQRKSAMIAFLKDEQPDVIGLQEPIESQLNDISGGLGTHYDIVGQGRGSSWWGKGADELNPLVYNKNRLTLEDSGTFSLNESSVFYWPLFIKHVGLLPRICTWASFTTQSGDRINVYNTHLDHKWDQARLNQIKVILEKIKAQNFPGAV